MRRIVIVLTSGTSWVVPADFNNSAKYIQCIGGGTKGANATATTGGSGGQAGCGADRGDQTLSGTISYQIGLADGTTGSGTSPTSNTWFNSVTYLVAPGRDNTTTNIVGNGHSGGPPGTGAATNGGGGGGSGM